MCSRVLSVLGTYRPTRQSKTRLLVWSMSEVTVGISLAAEVLVRSAVVVFAHSITSWHSCIQDYSGSTSRVLWQRIVTTPGHKGSVTKGGRLKRRTTPTPQEGQIPPKPEKMESQQRFWLSRKVTPPIKDQLKIENGGFAASKSLGTSGFPMRHRNIVIHY